MKNRRRLIRRWFTALRIKNPFVRFGFPTLLLLVMVGLATRYILASPAFQPGETLNPDCGPTDPDCRVVVPRASQTYVVLDLSARDALSDIQVGDHVIVTSIEKSYVWTQANTWQELPNEYPSHTHVVPDFNALNALGTTHELRPGDHAEVTSTNKTYVYTQDGVWQELLTPVNRTYVVPDIAGLNALTDVQIGDHAEVTSISKSYIRTQDDVWQELLTPPSTIEFEHVYVVADQAARDALTNLRSGDLAIVTDSNTSYVYTQDSTWQEILTPPEQVHSVNGKTGNVTLQSDDIVEGGANAYFTSSRARSAVSAAAPLSYDSGTGVFGLSYASPLTLSDSNLTLNAGAIDIGSLMGTLAVNKGGTGRTTAGSANQLLAMNTAGTALEYKTLTAGSNITVTPAAGSATVAVSASPTFTSVGAGSLTINGGAAITGSLSVTASNVTSASITYRTCAAYATISVPGAAVGDAVVATPTPVSGGIETVNLSWNAYVSAGNTVMIRACNVANTGTINTPNTQTWRVDVWRH